MPLIVAARCMQSVMDFIFTTPLGSWKYKTCLSSVKELVTEKKIKPMCPN